MFNLYEDVEELTIQCLQIEKKLPAFFMKNTGSLSELEIIRQRLYAIRCDIGQIQNTIKEKNLNYEV
jgi:hypothetical protein